MDFAQKGNRLNKAFVKISWRRKGWAWAVTNKLHTVAIFQNVQKEDHFHLISAKIVSFLQNKIHDGNLAGILVRLMQRKKEARITIKMY